MALDNNSIYNLLISLLFRKVLSTNDFHEQSLNISQMLKCDSAGLVDSLTQFQVECSTVDLKVDADNETLNDTFEEWLENINSEFRGKGIEVGIKGLMKEYYKERWRGASFPVLKITKWDKINGINFPVSMMFVDGGSVYADKKDDKESIDLFAYNYFVGKDKEEKIEGQKFFIYKPFCRSFEKYPTPYLYSRGVYKNWKLIDMIKDKEYELVDRIIPYMLLVLKGSEALTGQNITYSAPELEGVKVKIQEMMNKLDDLQIGLNGQTNKTPIRVSNWDEEIKHLIPDLKAMFQRELFETAEKHILAGLGFIDIAEATSDSRRQSVLNPKVFIKECNAGLSDFVNFVLGDLLSIIKEKNTSSPKYTAKKWIVDYDPITEFMSDNFLTLMRSLSDRGLISNETADFVCSQGGVNYDLEVIKRSREAREGHDALMYPKIIQNIEERGTDIREVLTAPEDQTKDFVNEDKKGVEAKNFAFSELELGELDDDSLVFLDSEEIKLHLSKWKKNRVTENYIRRGQVDPSKFKKGAMRNGQTFATIVIKGVIGVKAIIGIQEGHTGTSIQSYLFDKKKFTSKQVDEWLKNHKSGKTTLTGAPYEEIGDLPPSVRKRLSLEDQRKWMSIWNSAYKFYLKKLGDSKKAETMAFRTAWSKVKTVNKSFLGVVRSIFKKGDED